MHIADGYATLLNRWKAGDVIEINFPMNVRRIKANDQVIDDKGKLAIERGPVMYCLEGKDQTGNTVFNKFIPDGTPMEATYDATLLNGIVVLIGTAKEVQKMAALKRCHSKLSPILLGTTVALTKWQYGFRKQMNMPASIQNLLLPAKQEL